MKKLCSVADIPQGQGREFTSGAGYIAVFQSDDGPIAWRNSCPHQGRSLNYAPDEFLFTGEGRLVCPHHGAVFELSSGACLDGPCKGAALTPVAIQLRDGEIWLEDE